MEERIIELEIRSSFQDQKLEALSEALYAQQKEIDRLTSRLEAADRRIAQLGEGDGAGPSPANDEPPHY